jgi:predicted  nucleic acid-binding Zn-ribbon protein
VKHAHVRRDEIDLEIVTTKEKIEKYKEQQFQIKTNKQYDALTREIDVSQERVKTLEKEMESIEGKSANAKTDLETLTPELQELRKELKERQAELDQVNKEHEDEELKLKHEREKLIVRIDKSDVKSYERIRKALGGKAVVAVRKNACGGCFKRVPPQVSVELRKNSRVMICEHCGRLLVSDDIVESYTESL